MKAGKSKRVGRSSSELRPITIERGIAPYAEGSCLISFGATRVLCTASVEEGVPAWRRGRGEGWLTAEYAMLPRATRTRTARERAQLGGRTQEIQRLIGRSVRAMLDDFRFGEFTIKLDCDVLVADGGTRTAAITGAMVALGLACQKLMENKVLARFPLKDYVAAVSVGIVGGEMLLDLCYAEDSNAELDMNVVMTGSGQMVEVQATGEGRPFGADDLQKLIDLAHEGIQKLLEVQRSVLKMDVPARRR